MPSVLPKLRVDLLGKLRLSAGERATTHFETRRTALLLARLALPPLRDWSREELIELLWPEEDPGVTRTRFRQTLASLRRALEGIGTPEEGVLNSSRASVGLNLEQVVSDVVELESCLRRAGNNPEQQRQALDKALELYDHHLLPGFYESWVLTERERLSESLRQGLLRFSQAIFETEHETALEYTRRAVALDPLSEVAQAQVLSLLMRAGRPAEAARQLKEVERLFWKELRTEPPDALRAIVAGVVGKPMAPPVPSSASVMPPSDSIQTLPRPLDRFFGRETEYVQLLALLKPGAGTPLVTLTGPPGVGKTRLALEVGARLLQDNPEQSSFFVPLEAVTDVNGALQSLQKVVGGRTEEQESAPVLASLIHLLRRRTNPLLILDNAETVVGLAEPLQQLLQGVSSLVCLVTSQQPLKISGEQEVVLGSLGGEQAAVELFLDRGRRVRPGLELSLQNQGAIRQLCSQLDGLPLALELAATWLSVFSPEQIRQRLEQDDGLLVRRGGGAVARHDSLRSALEESFARLTPNQHAALLRLAVFRDGWTLEAAEAVCASICEEPILELEALRTASLITAYTLPDGRLRFFMLATIAATARRLQSVKERQEAERAHIQFFCSHAERGSCLYDSSDHLLWYDHVVQEQENLAAALESAVTHDPEQGARIAVALRRFWERQGRQSEAKVWLEKFLALLPDEAVVLRASANLELGLLLLSHRRYLASAAAFGQSALESETAGEQASAALGRCMEASALRHAYPDDDTDALLRRFTDDQVIVEQLGSLPQKALVVGHRGSFHAQRREITLARQFLERSMTLFRIIGNQRGMIWCLHWLGYAEGHRDALEAAVALYQEAIILAQKTGEDYAHIRLLWNLADAQLRQEEFAAAQASCQSALALTQRLGMRADESIFYGELGRVMAAQGNNPEARRWFREGLRLADSTSTIPTLLHCLRWLVRLALRDAQQTTLTETLELAAHLWGILLRLEELLLPGQAYDFDAPLEADITWLEEQLGESFTQQVARCSHYGREEAVLIPQLYPEETPR